MTHIERRTFLFAATSLAGLAAMGCDGRAAVSAGGDAAFASDPVRKITEDEWAKKLGEGIAYTVLRQEDTEDPGTSPLLAEHRKGTFYCKGCDLPLFESKWKFESGTGWPSFFDCIKANIGTKTDVALAFEKRTEYHCARCLGHQGHVFPDGPRPTGLRYCNNGAAITFRAA